MAAIVDGVTKLDRVRFDSKEAQQAATMRKMLVAMAKDLRVLIIKLADRLHNMRTLAALPEWKQERIARETLDIYAPLAHRLGMQEVKQQLEDLAFATLHPKRYAEIDQMVAQRAPERDLYLFQVLEQVQERLQELRIDADVSGRPKHLWSIYEKMVVKGRDFDDIFDLVGIRVLVDSVKDCYAALGSIHATWKPVQGRFKDYIAMPKFNLYQSLHTTVIGPLGKPLEVQIRTREMHHRAENGVAAHWAYKDGDGRRQRPGLAQPHRRLGVGDLRPGRVHGQPQGRPRPGRGLRLHAQGPGHHPAAQGATPIDFAYAIHTEVGPRLRRRPGQRPARRARLPAQLGRHRARSSPPRSRARARHATGWASWPRPAPASKIRQWFSRERREDAIDTGRDDLIKALRRAGLPVQKLAHTTLEEVATSLNYVDVDALYAAIGEHHVSAASVAAKVERVLRSGDPEVEEQLPATVQARAAHTVGPARPPACTSRASTTCWCGSPVAARRCPTTRSSASSPGAAGCRCTAPTAPTRCRWPSTRPPGCIDVEWDEHQGGVFVASIEVKALDRSRLLRDVSAAVADHHVNILACQATTGSDRISKMRFDFELGDPSHLGAVLRTIKGIDGVYDAYRVVPGARPLTLTPPPPLPRRMFCEIDRKPIVRGTPRPTEQGIAEQVAPPPRQAARSSRS